MSTALLAHLAEVDARGLYRQHAYSSMFEYCVQVLHLSEGEAYLRIRAARLGREFPRVFQMLAAGELHLSGVKLLAPVLTRGNCDDLLSAARLKSKRDVELLLAERSPQPDVASVIRRLPQPKLVPERVTEERTLWSAIASSAALERRELGPEPQSAQRVQRGPVPAALPMPKVTQTPNGQSARCEPLQAAAHRGSAVA